MTIAYLVTSKKSAWSAVIIATSYTDARQYNASVSGLGGTLTRLDLPNKQPPYFLGVHTTPKAQEAIRQANIIKGL